jgi:hypothetical protein
MEELGCVVTRTGGAASREACRDAATRILATLTDEERARYCEARNQLARNEGTRLAEVWVLGSTGAPQARRVRFGITDGLFTEIVEGDLRKGNEIIVGAAPAMESSGAPGL